ncbi:MAG: PfkB family carbohydrate kinase [Paracoccaceae bacterium]
MPDILCAGLIALDLVFEIDIFPVKGTKNKALSSRMITGGGALNAASAVASLGGKASLAGVVGDDMFGHFLRDVFEQRGIIDQFVQVKQDVTTSRSANVISPDGDRTIINHRDAALVPDALDLPSGFPFDAALVDTRWPAAAHQIAQAAKRHGKPAVVDAEAPVADAVPALEAASHVVFSQQGLADFAGEGPKALEEATRQLGGWCAVTRGAFSVLCHDGQRLFEVPVRPVDAVNTLGAGDVWHAAFTLALAKGCAEGEAVHWANAAASLKVARPLNVEELPTATEVDAILSGAAKTGAEVV